MLVLAMVFAAFAFSASPTLLEQLGEIFHTALDYDDIPSPFTVDLFSYIFLNNIGHFWNPLRMFVWVPALGPIVLLVEIVFNSGLIGVVAVLAGINKGLAYPIIGLLPHGIIEIPAFLLQFSSIVLWQTTITEAAVAKLRGRHVKRDRLIQGLKDTFILAATSIMLLLIAALIETYVTPFLLEI